MKRVLLFLVACAPAAQKKPEASASMPASIPEMQTDANTQLAASVPSEITKPEDKECDNKTQEGIAAELKREADVAEDVYKKALEKNDDCGAAARALMLLQLRAGKTKDAELAIKVPLAKHPNNVTLRLAWAEFLMATGAYVQAEKEALAVMHADEKSAGAMLVLSHAYYAEKKYELSRFAAENARDVDPQNAEAYHQLGVLYLQKNQHAQALTAFRKATELRPDAYASQINLSELLTEAGDFEGALVAAEAALQFVPNSDNARLVHANALRGVQRYRDAETEYQKLIDKNPDEKNPNTARATYNLAILYLDADIEGMEISQRLQKAIDEFNAFSKSNPPADEVALVQGYVTQAKRQIEAEEKRRDREAKKAAKKAASQPTSAPAKK